MRFPSLLYVICLSLAMQPVHAQEVKPPAMTGENSVQLLRLDELATLVEKKVAQRDELNQLLANTPEDTLVKERETLIKVNRDIAKLNSTFELVALGDTDISLLGEAGEIETTWQQDLLDVLKPLIDSLKSITKRPRQIAELRDSVFSSEAKLAITAQALNAIGSLPEKSLVPEAVTRLSDLETKWLDEKQQLEQERLLAQSQLDRLTDEQQSFFQGILPATRAFLLGRGLTLLLAIAAMLVFWALMKLIWWFYTRHFTTKTQRRNSTWFRLAAYSYYLLTSIVVVCVALVVLYIREDLLLLALSFLLIAGTVLSMRQFLPRYIKEARILLNLGSVREDERVIYNGLPWQVMSLNLSSVLRNPALDGVIRLPLDVVSTLVSRPVKNNLWFPSNRGDYVILPDGALGQIRHQTPDLVEISVRGGMSMTYNTSEFYSINLINLSREESFGVSVTFGFDYALQSISLTDIPQNLDRAIRSAIKDAGYEKQLKNLIVELSAANSSSLDFLIFATMDSRVAKDYYKLERLIQQTCISVSNERQWTIPFPQLTVHQSANVHKVDDI